MNTPSTSRSSGHRDAADPLRSSLVARRCAISTRGDLVADRDPAEQQAEARVGGGVEDVARDDDERLPQRLARHQQPREARGRSGRRSRTRSSGRASGRGAVRSAASGRFPPWKRAAMLVNGRSAGVRSAAIAALVAAARVRVLVAGVAARGRCGGVEQAKPRKDVNLGPGAARDRRLADAARAAEPRRRAATGPTPAAAASGPRGSALIRDLRRKDHLPQAGRRRPRLERRRSTKGDIREALDLVGKKRTLGLVTPRETGGGAGHDADVVRSEARSTRTGPCCSTGSSTAPATPAWFQPDGLHLTFDGAEAMAPAQAAAQAPAAAALTGADVRLS